MPDLESAAADFARLNAQVVGISADSIPSHLAWQRHKVGALSFPLASDFYPHAEVIRRYGLLREGPPIPGISNRAVIVVDKAGKVAWKKIYDLPTKPDVDEILAALQALR